MIRSVPFIRNSPSVVLNSSSGMTVRKTSQTIARPLTRLGVIGMRGISTRRASLSPLYSGSAVHYNLLSTMGRRTIHKLATKSSKKTDQGFASMESHRKYPHFSSSTRNASMLDIRACSSLPGAKCPEYVAGTKLHNLIWRSPLQNIYVVKKPWNPRVRDAMVEFIEHVHSEYPAVNVIVSQDVADELAVEWKAKEGRRIVYTGSIHEIVQKTDLIVTMGGDGTILRAVSAFASVGVPPVLSFSMGTLGFLLPFDYSKCKESFRMVYESRAKVLHRNRLECTVKRVEVDAKNSTTPSAPVNHSTDAPTVPGGVIHAMNDITLHRGNQPHLTSLDIYIDNGLLTTTTADGVVISTPTGSTAYSLSAGGSIVHPLVPCILVTPICPRSLSFRPIIVPQTTSIMIKLSENNRNSSIKLNIDGIAQKSLRPGDEIYVSNPRVESVLPTVTREDLGSTGEISPPVSPGIWCVARTENDWTADINELLGFNSSFGKI